MRHKEIGQIDEGLWLFGTEESCVYLLEGDDSSALISAGISYIIPDILRQIATWKRSQRKIRHIIILHSHFDHIGIVPYLKRIQPDLNIYASERAWKILSNPKAASVMEDYTLKVCKRVRGNTDDLAAIDWQWRQDIFGDSLRQGSRIELGGRHIEFHESPGHSSCSLTAYVPELKALFPSDAAAIPYRDEYVIAAGSSFDEYKKSLDRLGCLDVEIIGADHYGYITKSVHCKKQRGSGADDLNAESGSRTIRKYS
jgi:glyoxylase-like metal-dependent hydrolase (beta-lactamase superfamily II)